MGTKNISVLNRLGASIYQVPKADLEDIFKLFTSVQQVHYKTYIWISVFLVSNRAYLVEIVWIPRRCGEYEYKVLELSDLDDEYKEYLVHSNHKYADKVYELYTKPYGLRPWTYIVQCSGSASSKYKALQCILESLYHNDIHHLEAYVSELVDTATMLTLSNPSYNKNRNKTI